MNSQLEFPRAMENMRNPSMEVWKRWPSHFYNSLCNHLLDILPSIMAASLDGSLHSRLPLINVAVNTKSFRVRATFPAAIRSWRHGWPWLESSSRASTMSFFRWPKLSSLWWTAMAQLWWFFKFICRTNITSLKFPVGRSSDNNVTTSTLCRNSGQLFF